MKVYVYYNLHKHLWSVKALEGINKGRVIAHEDDIELFNCVFKVSQAGRERVLKENRKNVHAGVVGVWHRNAGIRTETKDMDKIRYNPYLFDSFVVADNLRRVSNASTVVLTRFGEVFAKLQNNIEGV
jgi:hypothetical protein